MKIIISSHCDTVFTQPYAILINGTIRGANDNFASLLAIGSVIEQLGDAEVQFTEDEEMYMDGAKSIAKKNNPKDTMIIVMDVTEASPGKGWFTIENIHELNLIDIKKALKGHKYKIIENGAESEAWLYAEKGFSVLEIDIPVKGGCHNLQSETRVENIVAVGKALVSLVNYFKDKDISAVRGGEK